MEKLQDYQGTIGCFHNIRDNIREKYLNWRENHSFDFRSFFTKEPQQTTENEEDEYACMFRKKTRCELVRISAAVMGIEFSYAAETAFVSPTLLEIGVEHSKMTMVWALSPLIGLFLTPVLGSLSDKCSLNFGRRRPFIILLSIAILIGLILVPNGKELGKKFGDYYPPKNTTLSEKPDHSWGVFFTVLGTVLLDFDADACQSPSRAYLLDVTIPEDHARGLSTFAIMAGLGGSFGYGLGGINWDATALGALLGGHVKAVFSFITVLFVICVTLTITSFKEIPLNELHARESNKKNSIASDAQHESTGIKPGNYGTIDTIQDIPTLKDYLLSIIYMPHSIRMLCLTNLFCWSAHVCYSLYFTDYVGESVFGGDPQAPEGSQKHELYEEGVRFGCWGMSMYSLSCTCYSLIIEKLIKKFKAKKVYVGGLLFFGAGMILMAIFNNKFAVIVFSWAAGVMYSTLFTMPFLLIAHYHSKNMFDTSGIESTTKRGLGTDIAIVGSMVFLAQFTLSLCVGHIVSYAGTIAIVCTSAFLSICGSVLATQVMYLDL